MSALYRICTLTAVCVLLDDMNIENGSSMHAQQQSNCNEQYGNFHQLLVRSTQLEAHHIRFTLVRIPSSRILYICVKWTQKQIQLNLSGVNKASKLNSALSCFLKHKHCRTRISCLCTPAVFKAKINSFAATSVTSGRPLGAGMRTMAFSG